MKLFAPVKRGSFDCTFCLECIHACPGGNVGIFPVLPGSALLSPRPKRMDAAVLAWALTLGAIVNAALMTDPVMGIMHRWGVAPVAGSAYAAAAGIAVLLAWKRAARAYAFALIPLGFSMWLAHFGYHFALGWRAMLPLIERIPGAQLLALDLGLILSLYVVWRTSKRQFGRMIPWALAALAIYGAAVWIVFQPMEMRGMLM